MTSCTVTDCAGKYVARGLCAKHYQRAVKSGDLTTAGKTWKRGRIQHQDGTACVGDRCASCIARFLANVDKTPGCWEWTGSTRRRYGRFRYQGRWHGAHRLARPEHLVMASAEWNAKRQQTWLSDTCKSGHLRTPENVYIERSTGKRKCRPCAAERQRRYRERRAAARDLIAAVAESLGGAA